MMTITTANIAQRCPNFLHRAEAERGGTTKQRSGGGGASQRIQFECADLLPSPSNTRRAGMSRSTHDDRTHLGTFHLREDQYE
jgi:hypothetical protein